MKFTRATKTKLRGRIGIMGPSGSGKTWTALLWAQVLGKRIAFIDSENKAGKLYAGEVDARGARPFDFDHLPLPGFAPRIYIEALHIAETEGYDVIVVDGLSQAWAGKGGVLEYVDEVAARSRSKNTFSAWREGSKEQNALVEALVGCKTHLIVTMRSKVEYVLDDERGSDGRTRKVPRKVGMAPIQREGLEYEFDLVGDMDWENRFVVTKSRCPSLSGKVFTKPGPEVAKQFLAWLDAGVEAPQISGDGGDVRPEGLGQPPSPITSNGTHVQPSCQMPNGTICPTCNKSWWKYSGEVDNGSLYVCGECDYKVIRKNTIPGALTTTMIVGHKELTNGTPAKLSDCLTAEQVTAWVVGHAEALAKLTGVKLTDAHATVVNAAKRVGIDPVALWNLEAGHPLTAYQLARLDEIQARFLEFTHPVALNNWWKKHEEEIAAEGPEFYDAVQSRSAKRHAELAGQ